MPRAYHTSRSRFKLFFQRDLSSKTVEPLEWMRIDWNSNRTAATFWRWIIQVDFSSRLFPRLPHCKIQMYRGLSRSLSSVSLCFLRTLSFFLFWRENCHFACLAATPLQKCSMGIDSPISPSFSKSAFFLLMIHGPAFSAHSFLCTECQSLVLYQTAVL